MLQRVQSILVKGITSAFSVIKRMVDAREKIPKDALDNVFYTRSKHLKIFNKTVKTLQLGCSRIKNASRRRHRSDR